MKFTVCKTKEKSMKQPMFLVLLRKTPWTRRKLKLYKTFRRRQVRLLNVLCTPNLSPMSRRKLYTIKKHVLGLVQINNYITFTNVLDSLPEGLNFTKAY